MQLRFIQLTHKMSLCIKIVLVILSLKGINPVSYNLISQDDLDDFMNALTGVLQHADDNKDAAIKPNFVFGAFVANGKIPFFLRNFKSFSKCR